MDGRFYLFNIHANTCGYALMEAVSIFTVLLFQLDKGLMKANLQMNELQKTDCNLKP